MKKYFHLFSLKYQLFQRLQSCLRDVSEFERSNLAMDSEDLKDVYTLWPIKCIFMNLF